ncbi:PPIC-type PPIASE family protein,tetratricopeptide repeat protein [Halobacteroides halobius DSM 5150]|uniref:PPIC-type PPIASE family protein,tetratricopeptide repeat protein n=1 Tax=Halobacteroides halobius (strain ATCC 35273 / DSM 5150 / MD-1) TaxID=748449 RepID=L0K9R7_HALHC|nr:PPIC-type PPIASE family protein,tetratricopeptide repeat protein [Halobacteroides halobius DSM 5150]
MLLNFFRERMKIIAAIGVIVFVAGGVLIYLNPGASPKANQAQAFDRPIATVNGAEVSYQKFNSQLGSILQKYKGRISPSQVLSLKSRVLNNMINQKLLVQQVKEKGLKSQISQEAVEEKLNQIIQNFIKQTPASSAKELDKLLKKQGRSLADIKTNLRPRIKESLAIQKLQQKITKQAKVTKEEVNKEYTKNKKKYKNKVTASHILIKTDKRTTKEAKAKANEILAKIKNGQEFSKMAKKYSEGPSGKKGGRLGSFAHGQMVPAFEKKAFSMSVGEVSKPVKTRFGYHLIKVTDKTNQEDIKEQIKDKLVAQQKQEQFNKWFTAVKDKADIVIKAQAIKAYQAFKDGKYKQAISGYKAAMKNNPQASYLYHNLAQVYQKQKKTDKVITTYQEAIKKYPKQINFYTKLANLYKKEGKTEKAINIYKQVLKKSKGNAQLHYSLGNLYRELDKKDKAVAQYDKFSELSGDNIMAHYRLYTVYQKMGLKEKAKQEMEKVKQIQKKRQQKSKEQRKKQ